MSVNNNRNDPLSNPVLRQLGVHHIKLDPAALTLEPGTDPRRTTTDNFDRQQGSPNGVQRQAPPLPAGTVKAPTRYESAPSIDEIVAGAATLEIGHKGPAVRMLQQALNKLGASPKLDEDGFLGPKTFEALKAFQEKAGVSPGEAGSVGTGTLEAFGQRLSTEDIESMRDRAVAAYAVAEGQVARVGKKNIRDVKDADIDVALGEAEWTPRMQGNVGDYKPMSQSDYRSTKTGFSSDGYTLAQTGCMLTSYAMAATGVTGRQDLDPKKANDIVKAAGGFSGGSLIGPTAARALGMREVKRTGEHQTSPANMRNQIDAALAKGQAVVLGVDYKDGSKGTSNGTGVDHWITITGKDAQGNYTAIDPVGGRQMTLTANAAGSLTGRGWASGTRYTGREAIILEKA